MYVCVSVYVSVSVYVYVSASVSVCACVCLHVLMYVGMHFMMSVRPGSEFRASDLILLGPPKPLRHIESQLERVKHERELWRLGGVTPGSLLTLHTASASQGILDAGLVAEKNPKTLKAHNPTSQIGAGMLPSHARNPNRGSTVCTVVA